MATPYDIAIHLSMANTVSPVLAIIGKDMLGLQTSANKLEAALNSVGFGLKAMIGGAASIFGGVEIGKGLFALADKGEEILHQQALMVTQGWQVKDMQDALNASWRTAAQIRTTSPAENMAHLSDIAYATGDMGGAIAILPDVAKANAVLNAMKGGGQDEVFNLVKALEQKGLATPEKRTEFLSYVDEMTKAVEASHGRVTPQSFQSAFIYGRTAMLGWDEDFITQIMPRLIQSWSGGGSGGSGVRGPGNALMTAFAKVVQGQISKTSAEEFESLGLTNFNRRIAGSSSNQVDVKGKELFGQDPYEWTQQYLFPALKAHKIDTNDPVKVGEEISKLFGVRTAAAVVTEMLLQGRAAMGLDESPFEKDRRLQQQSKGYDPSFGSLEANDPFTIMAEFTAQLKAMGDAMAPLAQLKLDFIKDLTPMIGWTAQMAQVHPGAVKVVAEALAALAAAMVAIGAGAVIVGAVTIMGPVTAAVAAISLAVATLAALNWGAVASGLQSIGSAFEEFLTYIGNLINKIKALVGLGPTGDSGPGPANRMTRDALGYLNNPNLQGIGNEVRAPPPPVVNLKASTTVLIDGKNIPSTSTTRVVNDSSNYDPQADPPYPDIHSWR